MNKAGLLLAILSALEALCQTAIDAAAQAHDAATDDENVAENKYDTLGLEAAYLAQGQAQRVLELKADLATFSKLLAVDYQNIDSIGLGALVQLKDEAAAEQWFFLAPVSGGLKLPFEKKEIVLVTPLAPLGKTLLGARAGEVLASGFKEYEVMRIC